MGVNAIVGAIEPVRGWVPEWYSWAQFGAGRPREARDAEPRPIHRKPTAAERMPVDVLLLKHNGELS